MAVFLINPSDHSFGTAVITPRWLYVLPNGDVLVAEAESPDPTDTKGVKGAIRRLVMGAVGAGAGGFT